MVSNPEPGQLVLSMRGGPGALELGEVRDYVEIQRGPRKPQNSSPNAGAAAIVQMAHQAHATESSRHRAGG